MELNADPVEEGGKLSGPAFKPEDEGVGAFLPAMLKTGIHVGKICVAHGVHCNAKLSAFSQKYLLYSAP